MRKSFCLLVLLFDVVRAFCPNPGSPTSIKPRQVLPKIAQREYFQLKHAVPSRVPATLTTLRGGGAEFVEICYDWCINLGAPAALVAGAVVATMYENVRGGALAIAEDDSNYTRFAKKLTNLLLLSSFGLTMVSLFATTITGTMLLSKDMSKMTVKATTALGFLRECFEFEYLTSRICFLQGLLNWLLGVAIEHTIPRDGQGKAARNMDRFVAVSISTLIALLLSFYDSHLTFYKNYAHMLARWAQIAFSRYFMSWPPRPMMFVYLPGSIYSMYTLVKALLPAGEGAANKKA